MAAPFDPYHRWLGIPPQEQPPNHYRLLALQLFEDDPDVIESAADQRMAHLRTFQTGKHSGLSQKLLNEVAAAKICLLKPTKRAAYDERLRRELADKEAEAETPRAPEPVDPQLAGLFARADRATPAVRARVATRKRPARPAIFVALAAAAALVILGLALRGILSTAETALVVDWPEHERQGATLQIDGQSFAVESTGPLQHGCPPGEHRVVAARPGFQPYAETFRLDEGQTKTIRPIWQKASEAVTPSPPTPNPKPPAPTPKPV